MFRLSRYLGRDRLSGDGSRMMGRHPAGQCDILLSINMFAPSMPDIFCAAESHRIMGSGERVSDSRTVFILMKKAVEAANANAG